MSTALRMYMRARHPLWFRCSCGEVFYWLPTIDVTTCIQHGDDPEHVLRITMLEYFRLAQDASDGEWIEEYVRAWADRVHEWQAGVFPKPDGAA